MASGRNLTVYLTSDVSKFQKGLGRAGKSAQSFGSRVKDAGKVAAAGLAIAAAAAVAVSAEAVKAAAADEDAQKRLARTLKRTTKATDAQVAAVEAYVDKASKASGIPDDEIRPGLERLVRSTKSTTKAQRLSTLAMRISLQTGKSYGTVVQGLVRANNGSVTSLKKLTDTLGPQAQNYLDLTAAQKNQTRAEEDAARVRETSGPKSKEYAKALDKVNDAARKVAQIKGNGVDWITELNDQFKGAIATDAGTYAGKLRRIDTALGEIEESFGRGVLEGIAGTNDEMGTFDDRVYEMQGNAQTLGRILGDIGADSLGAATNFAIGLQSIPTVWDNFINQISGGVTNAREFIGNIPLPGGNPLALDSATADAMRRDLDRQLARNNQTLSQIVNGPAAAPVSRLDTFSASSLYTVDPSRHKKNRDIAEKRADARTAQKEARTGNRP